MVVITPIEFDKADGSTSGFVRRRVGRPVAFAHALCAAALAATDAGAFALAFAVAVLVAGQFGPGWQPGEIGSALGLAAPLLGSVMLAFTTRRHYSHRLPRLAELGDIAVASLAALLCTGFIEFMLRLDGHRLLPLLAWSLFVPVAVLSRSLARAALRKTGLWQIRAVVIGSGETATEAVRILLSAPRMGYAVAAVMHPALIGPIQYGRWSSVLRQHRAGLLVLAMDAAPRELTESLVRERVPFAVVPPQGGLPVLGVATTRFLSQNAVLHFYRDNLGQPVARAVKIGIDLAAAIGLLVALAPLLAFIAAAIKLDGGPVFYAHRRLGAGGRSFPCLKFRSMVADGDEVLLHVLSTDPAAAAEWAETRKLRHDPRVTWIGRFLRSTSLDELPQLFNVLRLEMSLVGPRPIVRAEVPRYGDDIHHYYATRPGLTGLWQVSGRSDTGYDERVQLDTWYVKNWSLWHDITILAQTVPAVLNRRGAV